MNIMLACCAGMSTSILVQKMKKAAKDAGKDYKIWATTIDNIELQDDPFDIVMIGPQVAYRYDDARDMAPKNVPVVIIPKEDYGKGNGANVVALAEQTLGIK